MNEGAQMRATCHLVYWVCATQTSKHDDQAQVDTCTQTHMQAQEQVQLYTTV